MFSRIFFTQMLNRFRHSFSLSPQTKNYSTKAYTFRKPFLEANKPYQYKYGEDFGVLQYGYMSRKMEWKHERIHNTSLKTKYENSIVHLEHPEHPPPSRLVQKLKKGEKEVSVEHYTPADIWI